MPKLPQVLKMRVQVNDISPGCRETLTTESFIILTCLGLSHAGSHLLLFSFSSLSPSIPPATSSPSLPASPHVSRPSSLAVPPSVPGRAWPSFLQLQPLRLLPEPPHGAPTQLGPQAGPPSRIWPLLSYTGKKKSAGSICRLVECLLVVKLRAPLLCVFPQLVPESVLPLSPPLSASLLSEHVERERDEGGQERFRVRTLFHKQGDTSTQSTCITLHAFKETEEHKAWCMTQVRSRLSQAVVSPPTLVHLTCPLLPLFSVGFPASTGAVRGNSDAAKRLVQWSTC